MISSMYTSLVDLLTLTQCHVLYRARFKEGHFAPITRLFHWGLHITKTINAYLKICKFYHRN